MVSKLWLIFADICILSARCARRKIRTERFICDKAICIGRDMKIIKFLCVSRT